MSVLDFVVIFAGSALIGFGLTGLLFHVIRYIDDDDYLAF